jgi:hypothetical protein
VVDDLDVLGVGDQRLEHQVRLGRGDQVHLAVLAGEQQSGPVVAAVGVGDPVRLVEHQHLAAVRGLLHRAADDRREGVDLLLAGREADGALRQLGGQLGVGLVGQLAQRGGVYPRAGGGQRLQRLVGLAGVRRAEVEDDVLGPGRADGELGGGAVHPDLLGALLVAGGGAVGLAGGDLTGDAALTATGGGLRGDGHRQGVSLTEGAGTRRSTRAYADHHRVRTPPTPTSCPTTGCGDAPTIMGTSC